MLITLQSVSKHFGGVYALEKVSLEIPPGCIVAVLGANGAGKSTLLRLLSGLQVPTQGVIRFDGERFDRQRLDWRKRLMYLPDQPPVFPLSTPLGHLASLVKLYEAEREGLESLLVAVLGELDLLPLAECPIRTLSRGQAYKTALATLLAVDPQLWLLDEPFAAGMDPQGHAVLRRYASKATARGATVIYTTQMLELAEQFADYVLILDGGRLHAFDRVSNLPAAGSLGNGANHGVLERIFAQLRTGAV